MTPPSTPTLSRSRARDAEYIAPDRAAMRNKAMARKLSQDTALDLGGYPANERGEIELPRDLDIEELDLCVARAEAWIRSVGRDTHTGIRWAATDARFYQRDGYECLWLR